MRRSRWRFASLISGSTPAAFLGRACASHPHATAVACFISIYPLGVYYLRWLGFASLRLVRPHFFYSTHARARALLAGGVVYFNLPRSNSARTILASGQVTSTVAVPDKNCEASNCRSMARSSVSWSVSEGVTPTVVSFFGAIAFS